MKLAPPLPFRIRRPPGSLAWQQYDTRLVSGRNVTLLFSLADVSDKTIARLKRQHGAAHLGFLAVLDDPESLEEVVLWFQKETTLTLVSKNGDISISDEVRGLMPRYFTAFFDEVRELAPDLARVKFIAPKTGDKTLH